MVDKNDDVELRALVQTKATRYEAPSELQQLIRKSIAQSAVPVQTNRPWLHWPWLKLGAAMACGMVLSLLVTQMVLMPESREQITEEVVAAHVRSLMVAHLEDIVSTDQHTVKPWFSGKLDFSPPVNDFSGQGFPLTGGRLDYIDRHFAAALVYRRNNHVINVFIWPARSANESKSISTMQDGFSLISWHRDGMQFWLVSDVNAEELQQFSKLLH